MKNILAFIFLIALTFGCSPKKAEESTASTVSLSASLLIINFPMRKKRKAGNCCSTEKRWTAGESSKEKKMIHGKYPTVRCIAKQLVTLLPGGQTS